MNAVENVLPLPRRLEVLVADDDVLSRKILANRLEKQGYAVELASTGDEAWAVLERPQGPRLVVLDWMMPGLSGVDICRLVRLRGSGPYVYIVLLTGKDEQQDIVTGLEAGADDYLTKPFDFAELGARLRTGRRILELEEGLVAAREALHFQATHDHLTAALNREAIFDRLSREMARASRDGSPVAVVLLDLDEFKAVNDTYGHAVGDIVLRESTVRCGEVLRPYDVFGRYGGEEFLAVLPGCSGATAATVAERMRLQLSASPLMAPEGPVLVTASFGVASTTEVTTADPLALVRAADRALYRAKGAGRNRVEVAHRISVVGLRAVVAG